MDRELREQDRWLPIANVARIMKATLPPSAKVSKDAKECMQECVSEFIAFVTSEACERCLLEKRKTVNGEDILCSLHALGFENYAEVLKIYLAKYRQRRASSSNNGTTLATPYIAQLYEQSYPTPQHGNPDYKDEAPSELNTIDIVDTNVEETTENPLHDEAVGLPDGLI